MLASATACLTSSLRTRVRTVTSPTTRSINENCASSSRRSVARSCSVVRHGDRRCRTRWDARARSWLVHPRHVTGHLLEPARALQVAEHVMVTAALSGNEIVREAAPQTGLPGWV